MRRLSFDYNPMPRATLTQCSRKTSFPKVSQTHPFIYISWQCYRESVGLGGSQKPYRESASYPVRQIATQSRLRCRNSKYGCETSADRASRCHRRVERGEGSAFCLRPRCQQRLFEGNACSAAAISAIRRDSQERKVARRGWRASIRGQRQWGRISFHHCALCLGTDGGYCSRRDDARRSAL